MDSQSQPSPTSIPSPVTTSEPSADYFTPGPWDVGGARGYSNLKGVNICTRRWGLVLAVAIGDVPELKAHANARLIAAAPDQHVALVRLLEHYTQLVNCGDCGNWDPETEAVVIEARDAIAKALGPSAQDTSHAEPGPGRHSK